MSLSNFVLASWTLSVFPHWSFLNLFSLLQLSSWLSPACLHHFMVWSQLWTLSQQRDRSQQKRVKDILQLTCKIPTYTEVWSPPIFSPSCITVLTHIQLVIPQHHMLSQYCHLLRHPSSAFIYLFSLPHRRPSYLHLLNSHLTHFNHFCILSRSLWTLNLLSTIPKAYWSL